MTINCPLCQRQWLPPDGFSVIEIGVYWQGRALPLTNIGVNIFRVLWEHRGQPVPDERLHFALWGNREDGGPNLDNLKVQISYIRRVLRSYDVPFEIKRIEKPYKTFGFGSYYLCEVSNGR